jgi:AcrR family transcriptional regulator
MRPSTGAAAPTTRDLLLEAAGRRFAERGFAGVSVREIAADAGLKNQASIYHHFRNKQALYEAVVQRGIEPILALMAEGATERRRRRGRDGAGEIVERVFDYVAAHPHLPRLIQRAATDDRRHLPSSVPRLLRPLYVEGLRALADADVPWAASELPHLAAALYLLLFGPFANAPLLESIAGSDAGSPAALARQRRFVRSAIGRLLGGGNGERARAQATANRSRPASRRSR